MNRNALLILATAAGAILLTTSAARADGPAAPSTTGTSGTTSTTSTTSATPTAGAPADTTTAAITAKSSPADASERDTVTIYRKLRPNPAYFITGGLVLGGSYVTTAVFASQSDRIQDKNLFIPIAGPWLNLGDRQCSGCANETRNEALVIGSGIIQAAGAGLIILGFFVPKTIEAATIQTGSVRMNILPTQTADGGVAAAAVGTF